MSAGGTILLVPHRPEPVKCALTSTLKTRLYYTFMYTLYNNRKSIFDTLLKIAVECFNLCFFNFRPTLQPSFWQSMG